MFALDLSLLRGFFSGYSGFLASANTKFQNSNSVWKKGREESLFGIHTAIRIISCFVRNAVCTCQCVSWIVIQNRVFLGWFKIMIANGRTVAKTVIG